MMTFRFTNLFMDYIDVKYINFDVCLFSISFLFS